MVLPRMARASSLTGLRPFILSFTRRKWVFIDTSTPAGVGDERAARRGGAARGGLGAGAGGRRSRSCRSQLGPVPGKRVREGQTKRLSTPMPRLGRAAQRWLGDQQARAQNQHPGEAGNAGGTPRVPLGPLAQPMAGGTCTRHSPLTVPSITVPFLSSMVTVSFVSFIRNLRGSLAIGVARRRGLEGHGKAEIHATERLGQCRRTSRARGRSSGAWQRGAKAREADSAVASSPDELHGCRGHSTARDGTGRVENPAAREAGCGAGSQELWGEPRRSSELFAEWGGKAGRQSRNSSPLTACESCPTRHRRAGPGCARGL